MFIGSVGVVAANWDVVGLGSVISALNLRKIRDKGRRGGEAARSGVGERLRVMTSRREALIFVETMVRATKMLRRTPLGNGHLATTRTCPVTTFQRTVARTYGGGSLTTARAARLPLHNITVQTGGATVTLGGVSVSNSSA